MNIPAHGPPMDTSILDRIASDFGNHGARAAQFLKTAEMLIGSLPSAPRIGEVIAYCIREALVEVPRAAGSAETESAETAWKHLSRRVVDASSRYTQARGLTGMNERQALEDLLESISDLAVVHSRESIHTERLREIINFRTGLPPLTRNVNAFTEYQRLIDDIQQMVHTSANAELIAVDRVEPYLQRSLDVLASLFSVDSRMEQIQHLATLEQPSSTDVATLRTQLITPHDQSFFASFVNSPAWLDLMMDYGLLDPPENGGERWLAAMMIYRLRDRYSRYIADWLGRAWNRWSSTERGISLLADAAFQAGEYGHETLILCLKRKPNAPEICNLASLALTRIESSNPHVATFADLLLNPAAALDQHFERDVLNALVEGINSDNCINRICILKHKLRTRMESELPFYISDSATITSISDDISYDYKSSWKFLSALVQALRKAITLDSALVDLLDEIKGLPEEVGSRIQAWLRTNARDTECQESIEFIALAIQTRRPTTDDVLLVDSIIEQCGLGSTVSLWQEALGSPPDPVSLGTITRQDRVPDDLIRLWYWSVVLPTEVAGSWRETQAILGAAQNRVERDDWLRPPPRPTSRSGPNSPFEAADLESRAPEEAADLIADWRPNEADSWELRSPRGIGRQLEKTVGENPRKWANSPVEMVARLKHPTYIAHFFRGLVVGIAELRDTASLIIEAIVFVRTHPWPVEPLGRDYFDADTDWSETDRAGIDLINALAKQHLPLEEIATKQAWALVIQAARDRDMLSSIREEDDPLTSAINRPCTRAVDAILSLIEYEYKRSGVVPQDALALLTECLGFEGRDGEEHRAILAHRIPFLQVVCPQWFEENLDLLLGSKAPPGLAQMTIDLWLRWGRASEWMLKQFRCHILDAVRRKSEHALQGFLLGVFWDIPGYDAASCVRDLANLGPKYISACGETAARMIEPEDTNPEHMRRGIALWEHALRVTTIKEALQGFGWWVEVPTIESEEWERLTLETCKKAEGNLDWARKVAERASSRPTSTRALQILTLLVRGSSGSPSGYGVIDHALKALEESSEYSSLADERDQLRSTLLERGHFRARDAQ